MFFLKTSCSWWSGPMLRYPYSLPLFQRVKNNGSPGFRLGWGTGDGPVFKSSCCSCWGLELGSVPRTHVKQHTMAYCLQPQFQGVWCPLLDSWAPAHMWHVCIHTHTHLWKIFTQSDRIVQIREGHTVKTDSRPREWGWHRVPRLLFEASFYGVKEKKEKFDY